VCKLAVAYRQRFHNDVVIDLVGYVSYLHARSGLYVWLNAYAAELLGSFLLCRTDRCRSRIQQPP
jgi:hypothetical protein